jgi:transaldolase/glucose-6-phosphate isomerase
VTLLFSRAVCKQALEAYMAGLELLAEQGGDLTRVASVASLFVSRLDVMVDPLLDAPTVGGEPELSARRALVGKVAIAHAKLTYRDWKETCLGARWQKLAQQGARVQRLLWASTSAKDPRMRDVAYVEALIGPDTVDTIPPATLDVFRDHGRAENRLEQDVDAAAQLMASLAATGISIDELTSRLLDEGVKSFAAAFDDIMATIEEKRSGLLKSALDRTRFQLPAALDQVVHATLERLARRRQSAPAVGARRFTLDWQGRAQVARLARRR